MIDIHSHLLPGLDDGAKTLEESLGIAVQLKNAGFRTVIATPHVMEGRDFLTPEHIINATLALNEMLKKHNIALEVLPGAENYLFPDIVKWYREGKLISLANTEKYLLVEFPMLEIPHYTDQAFFDLQVAGVTPVLAHPERNKALVEEPERLFEWAERGILFQIDLRSLSGRYGPEAKRFAGAMIESQVVHFIGSDAHRVTQSSHAYTDELEQLREAKESEYYERITRSNPQSVLKGDLIQPGLDYNFSQFEDRFNLKKTSEKSMSWIKRFASTIMR